MGGAAESWASRRCPLPPQLFPLFFPGLNLFPIKLIFHSAVSTLGISKLLIKKEANKGPRSSSSRSPSRLWSQSPLISATSASKPEPWTTLACDPPCSENLLSFKGPWLLLGKTQPLIGCRGTKTFTADETSIVKISSNSATSMHREYASATSNARLFQLQQ